MYYCCCEIEDQITLCQLYSTLYFAMNVLIYLNVGVNAAFMLDVHNYSFLCSWHESGSWYNYVLHFV